jgi:protein-L-isoaspartate(D-aspartate) O-methyltransferase
VNAAERANLEMIDRLIAQEALWSPWLIDAFRRTPRHHFLDRVYLHDHDSVWLSRDVTPLGPEEIELIYSDRALTTRLSEAGPEAAPVPISSSSQPSLMAEMLEDLRLAAGQRILEVGAGTGYNAALLACVVGRGNVFALDVDHEVLEGAQRHLDAFADRRVRLLHGDGRLGYPAGAPFNRIMVTAATPDLEPAWLAQLTQGGLLLAPLVLGPGLSFVVRGTVKGGVFHGRLTRPAYFMPLRAEHETGPADSAGLSEPGSLETVPAPWADWLGSRRGRLGPRGFLQSLAFYGLLRGLSVSCQTQGETTLYGVSDLVRGCACWFGPRRWHVSGAAGRALGESLWRAYLDAGAPWPTEFDLRAAPGGKVSRPAPETYVRRGPHCQQLWQLRNPRERPALF